MNTQNYASLEASKKLQDAGVKLKTDCVWCPKSLIPTQSEEWILITNARFNREYYDFDPCVPAPSMAEVWRELPNTYSTDTDVRLKILMSYQAGYKALKDDAGVWFSYDTNPTDALAELLIFVRKEQGNENIGII